MNHLADISTATDTFVLAVDHFGQDITKGSRQTLDDPAAVHEERESRHRGGQRVEFLVRQCGLRTHDVDGLPLPDLGRRDVFVLAE
jgi:hypothetical protein